MADDNSEAGSEFPTSSKPDLAYMPRLHDPNLQMLGSWQEDQAEDFQHRFNVPRYYFPPQEEQNGPSTSGLSDTSSMAVGPRSHTTTTSQSYGSSYEPSLTSVSTLNSRLSPGTSDIGSSGLNYYSLPGDPDDLFHEQPSGRLQCQYGYLNCNKTFDTLDEWDLHCKAHFRPYREQECPFSYCRWSVRAKDGEAAWSERLTHIYLEHQDGTVDCTKKPSRHLIDHLFRENVVNPAEKQELQMFGRLTGQAYTTTGDPRRERREIRRGRTAIPLPRY